ncbi:MAG: pentapeptide repeat-containing protein [Hyphomicrobiaceae bacterium]
MRLAFNRHGDLAGKLLLLNPWLNGLLADDCKILSERELALRQTEAALRRLKAGRSSWNAWSEAMLELGLQAKGAPAFERLIKHTSEIVFGREEFSKAFDVAGFVFPGSVDFSHVAFEGEAWLNACRFCGPANFSHATFARSGAWFEQSTFERQVSFVGSRWEGVAEARQLTCKDSVFFNDAVFDADVWFANGQFDGALDWSASIFNREAGFGSSAFNGVASFEGCQFKGGVSFDDSAFARSVSFSAARFSGAAWMRDVKFASSPSFDKCKFQDIRKLHLDNTQQTPNRGASELIADLKRRFSA